MNTWHTHLHTRTAAAVRAVRWSGALACLLALGWGAQVWANPPAAASTDTRLRCDVVYLPAHSTWTREVVLTHAGKRLRTVAIDGVAVYTFALNGPVVLTSLDNERIQLDLSQPAWRSDFRGLATGQGLCALLP